MRYFAKVFMSTLTSDQKTAIANNPELINDALEMFVRLNKETANDIKSGKIKL